MAAMKQILFRLGEEEYGLDIFFVEAIERGVSVLRVPTAPKHIAGLIQLRGEAIPVYNLRARFNMPAKTVDVMIITRIQGMKVALAVDEVAEIIQAEDKEVMAAPVLVRTAETAFVNRVTNVKGHMFISLDLNGLLREDEKREIQKMLRDQLSGKE